MEAGSILVKRGLLSSQQLDQLRLDRQSGRGAELVQRIEVERITGCDSQCAIDPLDRKDRVAVNELQRKPA